MNDLVNTKSALADEKDLESPLTASESPEGWRLYSLVMYNLSGIQKGIQTTHAAVQYARNFADDKDFQNFVDNHKTIIVLDGGPSGAMWEHTAKLSEVGIKHAIFVEPDLNDALSSIVFLVPESVYEMQQVGSGMEIGPRFGPKSTEPVNVTPDVWLAWFVKQFNLAKN